MHQEAWKLNDKVKGQARTVAWLMRWGLSDKEIGRIMGVCDGTVKIYARQVRRATDIKNRALTAVRACEAWGFPEGPPPRRVVTGEIVAVDARARPPQTSTFWKAGRLQIGDRVGQQPSFELERMVEGH